MLFRSAFFPYEVDLRGKEKKEIPASGKKSVFSVFLIALSVLGVAGIACIYRFYDLSDEEMTTLLGCGALMGVCLLAGFAGLLKGGGNRKEKRKGEREPFLQAEEYLPVSEAASLEGVLFREVGPQPDVFERGNGYGEDRMGEEQGNYGNTVLDRKSTRLNSSHWS